MVTLHEVTQQYKGTVALQNISVHFPEKKITAILGRSGSGKSTLLQLINGLIKPTTGTIHVNNSPLNYDQILATRLQMGYVVQAIGLFPHLTVQQNICMAGKIINTKATDLETRTDQLMTLTGLPHSYKNKFPFELSGGEQQRVGICRALFLNPPILLMDEPFGALDPITRYEMQQELLRLQQSEPRTILFVTHDMREAAKLADFILVLEKGIVQQYAEKEKVLSAPANGFVSHLIKASLA
jgi:osmoprotectant transport system ATP-binding protein